MALVIGAPTAAHAGWDTPISGTTSSDNDKFYLSSTFRTLTSQVGGYVDINVDVAPKLSNGTTPDGLKWRLYINGQYTQIWYLNQDPAAWVHLGWHGYPGTQFRNSFTRTTDCPNCNHNFSGNMNY